MKYPLMYYFGGYEIIQDLQNQNQFRKNSSGHYLMLRYGDRVIP